MPSPERPDRDPIPDIQKELTELRDARYKKVEAQNNSKAGLLKCAQQRVYEEAEDILRIAYENSKDPEKFILEVIEDYAKEEGISFLAAGARIGQYLSPEWARRVDSAVREYFEEFNFSDFAKLPKGNEEVETLKILSEEGYSAFLVVAARYPDDIEGRKKAFDKFFYVLGLSKAAVEVMKNDTFEEMESAVLSPKFILPEAREYLEKMKKNVPFEEYKLLIDLAYMHIIFSLIIKEHLPGFDCNDITIFFQKMARDAGLEIGGYMETKGHVVLKLDGYPLVFDTFDMKIRTVEECARQDGYGGNYHGSYFWRDREGEHVAQYEDSDSYPKKIVGYRKVERNAILASPYAEVCSVLSDVVRLKGGINSTESGLYKQISYLDPDYLRAELLLLVNSNIDISIQLFESIAERTPNHPAVFLAMCVLLEGKGDLDAAIVNYKRVLELEPNEFSTYISLAKLFEKKGSDSEEMSFRRIAFKLNPNDFSNCMRLSSLFLKMDNLDESLFYLHKASILPLAKGKNIFDMLRHLSLMYLQKKFMDLKYDFNGIGAKDLVSLTKFAEEVFEICNKYKVAVSEIVWEEIFPKGSSVDYDGGGVDYEQWAVNVDVLRKVEDWIKNNLK